MANNINQRTIQMAALPTTGITYMEGPTVVIHRPGNVRDENHLPAARRWNDRTVTLETLRATLVEEGVPVALIDKIAFPQPAAANGQANASALSLIPEEPEATKVEAEFARTLLNKPHMLMLRFRKGDLPFPQDVCERMERLKSRIAEQGAVLAKATSAIAEEATSSSCSKCMPTCLCTRSEKRATKYALLFVAIILYFELLNLPVAQLLQGYPALVTLYYVLMGATPTIVGGARVYSMYRGDVEADAQKDADALRHAAQVDFEAASVEMEAFLKANGTRFQELAFDLLHDWIDARPLSRECGNREYADFLAKTYRVGKRDLASKAFASPEELEVRGHNDYLKRQCVKMELQTGLISHYARYYFSTGHALLLEEMASLMPASFVNRPDELMRPFTGVIPFIVPSTNIPRAPSMKLEYAAAIAEQTAFISTAKSAIAKKDKLSRGNYLYIDRLELSCLSFDKIYPLWPDQRRGSTVARSSPPRDKDDEKQTPPGRPERKKSQ